MSIEAILLLVASAIFVNNFVLAKFLGICPFIGVSKQLDSAIGMGMAVTFVLTLSSIVTFLVYKYLLVPFEIQYLKTIAFILVIASLVQLVEMIIEKVSPSLYKSLGIYLPLITTNCAVLGAATINVQKKFDLLYSSVYGFGAGLGFTLALILMAGLRERMEDSRIPRVLRGTPIAFITAGLMSLAFMGFVGMIKE
ncbi:MAG: electron transport complex subunit RsxA [Spirochaetes bacterium]|nr:electron transport complex subunit RsxA [Spirochaetota bacterium]MCK5268169.1 electron transport complex subunit RsxA [Spirochaetota bacterium]